MNRVWNSYKCVYIYLFNITGGWIFGDKLKLEIKQKARNRKEKFLHECSEQFNSKKQPTQIPTNITREKKTVETRGKKISMDRNEDEPA